MTRAWFWLMTARSAMLQFPLTEGPTYSMNFSILLVLATNDLIPICLTLAFVTHHEPQGWYSILLSLITALLATATLSASYFDANQYGLAGNYYAFP